MKVAISVLGRFHAFDLAREVQRQGHLERLITSYPPLLSEKFGIPPHKVASLWPIELGARVWSKAPQRLRKRWNEQLAFTRGYDRMSCHFLPNQFDIFVGWAGVCLDALRVARKRGAKVVVERGSSHQRFQKQILEDEYERWGQKFEDTHPVVFERELNSYTEADVVAVPSLFVKKTFLDQGFPENRILHSPYGVSLDQFYPMPKEDNVFRVIHCGAVSIRKGVIYLAQAFKKLNLPRAELWLVGHVDPFVGDHLRKLNVPGLKVLGPQKQSELAWFYSQCDAFCLASVEEGLAMVQPQAMACGLPIIHTENTGGADIVREGQDGYCVPIRDVEAIADRIFRLWSDRDLAKSMGDSARKRALDSISWARYGERNVRAYEELLARH